MGRRRSLLDLSPEDRQQLAQLLAQYINDQALQVHSNGHDWHHPGSPRFFLGHREYLASFETFLLQPGNARFAPLPAWDPATTIPQEVNFVKPSNSGIARPSLVNLSPNIPKPSELRAGSVCSISSIEQLSTTTQPWHNQVHGQVGGTMADPAISPAALIFWPWHAFIDDIHDDWLSCPIYAAGNPAAYVGEGGRPSDLQGRRYSHRRNLAWRPLVPLRYDWRARQCFGRRGSHGLRGRRRGPRRLPRR
jgi:hypothetical protein